MLKFKEINTIVGDVVFNYSTSNYFRQKGDKESAIKYRDLGNHAKEIARTLGITIGYGMIDNGFYSYVAYGYKDKYIVRWCTTCDRDIDSDTFDDLKRHISYCNYPVYYLDVNNKLVEYENSKLKRGEPA